MNVLISLNCLCFTESINAGREKYLVEFVCLFVASNVIVVHVQPVESCSVKQT